MQWTLSQGFFAYCDVSMHDWEMHVHVSMIWMLTCESMQDDQHNERPSHNHDPSRPGSGVPNMCGHLDHLAEDVPGPGTQSPYLGTLVVQLLEASKGEDLHHFDDDGEGDC